MKCCLLYLNTFYILKLVKIKVKNNNCSYQKKVMLLLPPGGACSLTDDFSVVGPQLFPVAILCPNVSSS